MEKIPKDVTILKVFELKTETTNKTNRRKLIQQGLSCIILRGHLVHRDITLCHNITLL